MQEKLLQYKDDLELFVAGASKQIQIDQNGM